MNETAAKVREFIVRDFLFGDGSKINYEMSFLDNSILDSTGMLELIGFIEREFAITIDPTELVPDNLDSIRKVSEFVGRKKAEAGTAKNNVA